MAFVDLDTQRLVLRAVLAGPPGVGKSERLWQLGHDDGEKRLAEFGRTPLGPQRMAWIDLQTREGGRPVVLELYEWRGPERADARGKALARGLDALVYLCDARADRQRDNLRHLELLIDFFGRSRLIRTPNLLALAHMEEGMARLDSIETTLPELPWSDRIEVPLEDGPRFVEAVRLLGHAMLMRSV